MGNFQNHYPFIPDVVGSMKHTVVVNKKFAKFIGIKEHCFMTREMVTAARRLLLARTLSQLSPTFDRPSTQ